MKINSLLARFGSIGLLLTLAACGGADESSTDSAQPGEAYSPTTTPLGNFNVKCDQSPGQQIQQQSSYQQQQQQSGAACIPQFEYYSSVVTNFDVDLDCRNNQVLVTGKGLGQSSAAIPIQGDGSWKGQVSVDQSVANDGKGNVFCKVKTIVNFDGNASCSPGQEGLNWGTKVDFAQSSSSSGADLASLESSIRARSRSSSGEEMPGIAASSTPLASNPLVGDPLASDPSPSPSPTPLAFDPLAGDPSPAPIVSPSPSPSACAFSNPEPVDSRTLKIEIPDGAADLGCSAYGAGAYQISAGTQVTWTNHDTQPHTVTADSGSDDRFDSGPILPGKTFTHVFSAVGEFKYHSTLDPSMQGLIVVQATAAPSPSPTGIPTVSPSSTSTVGGGPVILPTEAPSPSPSPSVSPSPSPSPSVSPSPHPSVSPGTTPTPSVTQIVSCVVVNPCPIYAQTAQKCPLPAQQ